MATHRLQTATEVDLTTSYSLTINSVANGANAISSSWNNTGNRYMFAAFEANLDIQATPTLNALFKIWLLPSWDNTNFSDGDATPTDPTIAMATAMPVRATTDAQNIYDPQPVLLMPCYYKIMIMNDTGAQMETTGNTLSMWVWGYESV